MERSSKRRRTGGNDGTAGGASSTDASTEGQEVATSSGHDYEVFLSFKGPDTRAGFTDCLYTRMIDMGIRAYKDDEDLRKGEEFDPELLQAIEQSKISMPIFSKGYASSVWCLKELVKMVECQKTKGQKIMPIFYDVAPSEVQHQTGSYEEAFRSHEKKKRHDEKIVQEWKDALTVVGQINGWDLQSMSNRQEAEFARKVTQKVFSELKKACLVLSECLVSVDNHVDAIMEMIGAGTSTTRIIGIHGMGGIGKTTTAKMIYNKLSYDFENCCFLQDIRETSKCKGIECLQNQLISVILKTKCMDIKHIDEGTQMIKDRLFNKRVLLLLDDAEEANHINALVGKRDWLGGGSKVIITTRNKDILEVAEVDCSYELSGMDPDQSLQLFSKHAFRKDYPLDEYIGQSKRAIGIAGGLPLALEVIGSLLYRTKREKWDLTLKKLESIPHETVQTRLKISYDALDVQQQHIFLDIACLFIGYNKDIVVYFWDESKFPEEAMEVLQNMSLIKIKENNRVWMDKQLRDLGREIVRQESKMKIEKQSRVWDVEEGLDLLRKHKGNKEVEALRIAFDKQRHYCFTYEDFENLSNLRFLEVNCWGRYFHAEERLLWQKSSSNLIPENSGLLPQLRWLSWHDIPPTFNITNFSMENVVILDLSNSDIMDDWKGWCHMKVMKILKVLNLTDCHFLERTPNFSAHVKLELLILRGCSKLVEINGSICQLKRLVSLDVRDCPNLWRLPDEIGGLIALKELLVDSTLIEEIPNCLGFARRSKANTWENLQNLELHDLGQVELVPDLSNLNKLRSLQIRECGNLVEIQGELPQSLEEFKIEFCESLQKLPDLSSLKGLQQVEIVYCSKLNVEATLGLTQRSNANLNLWENLQILRLSELGQVKILPDLSNLNKLRSLQVQECGNLVEIQGKLPQSLEELEIDYCVSLQKLPDLSSLNGLQKVDINCCMKLNLEEILGFA